MKWKKVDEYHVISDSGYRVAKNYCRDVCKFSAYSPRGFPDWELLGFFDTKDLAAEACDKHASEKNRRQPAADR